MNIGKVIALFLGGLIVVLMLFMLFSSDSSTQAIQEPVKNEPKPVTQTTSNSSEFQTSDELNKIKELKQSVSVSSDGVSKLYLQSCAPCHARDGSGILAPSIIGKSKEDISRN